MAVSIPSQSSKTNKITHAVMPFLKSVARITLVYCVIMAAEAAYPGLPKHSSELKLLRFSSALLGFGLLKSVQWRAP